MTRVRVEIDVTSDVDEHTLKHWSLQEFFWAIENGDASEASRVIEVVRETNDGVKCTCGLDAAPSIPDPSLSWRHMSHCAHGTEKLRTSRRPA